MNAPVLVPVFLLFALLAGAVEAEPPELNAAPPSREPAPIMREERLDEPIFKGQSVVYEGGTSNPRSVVLVHGVGDNAAKDWDRLIPELVREYHVLSFDLPGFGRASKGNEEYSIANYARFLRWAISQDVHGPFTLIGHSFGGARSLFSPIRRRPSRFSYLGPTPILTPSSPVLY